MKSRTFERLGKALSRFYKKYELFLNYVVIAGFATGVNYVVLRLLREKLHLYVWLSAAVAYGSGMFANFLLNKYLNFASGDRSILGQARTFFFVALIGLGLNSLLMEFLVQWIHVPLTPAFVLSVGCVMMWSFWGHNALTFKGGFRSFLSQRLKKSGEGEV
jgi:putative flippase GtrA